uniref:Uncharacterized protein n=1 Tax=Streptomyces sp. NBC_00049 TaxID=2903617 RepID=A0AAU2JL99_9ACTN
MVLQRKAVALTVVGVAAGVAAFVAASGRTRAEVGRHLDLGLGLERHGSDGHACDGAGSCGTESSCGTAACGNGL